MGFLRSSDLWSERFTWAVTLAILESYCVAVSEGWELEEANMEAGFSTVIFDNSSARFSLGNDGNTVRIDW